MEVSATAKRIRMSAQKVRLVADQIRGLGVAQALDVLNFSTKAASTPSARRSSPQSPTRSTTTAQMSTSSG